MKQTASAVVDLFVVFGNISGIRLATVAVSIQNDIWDNFPGVYFSFDTGMAGFVFIKISFDGLCPDEGFRLTFIMELVCFEGL